MTGGTRRPGTLLDAVLAVAFLALLAWVAPQSGPLAVDSKVNEVLPPLHGSGSVAVLSRPAEIVTDLGHPTVWTVVTLLVGLVVAWMRRSWVPVRLVVLPVAVEAAVVLSLKAAVGRVGPPGADLPHPFGYFPSGHTATALVCTGALAALVATGRPGWSRGLRIGVAVWSLLMAAALVYCRYHWFTDVIGSLLLGLLVLRLCCSRLWAPRSRDDAPPQDDALRLREDA